MSKRRVLGPLARKPFLVRGSQRNVARLLPPLNIEENHVKEAMAG